jgi:hypothetical protein
MWINFLHHRSLKVHRIASLFADAGTTIYTTTSSSNNAITSVRNEQQLAWSLKFKHG